MTERGTVPRVGGQFHFRPEAYLDLVRSEVPAYDRLQDALARATSGASRNSILDLGAGTGVTSERVLAVHHLDGTAKADLFRRVAKVLVPGGRFVVGDVVVPEDPADAVTPIDDEYDTPSSAKEQMGWLRDAGFRARIAWVEGDLAVLVGDRRDRARSS